MALVVPSCSFSNFTKILQTHTSLVFEFINHPILSDIRGDTEVFTDLVIRQNSYIFLLTFFLFLRMGNGPTDPNGCFESQLI